MNGDNSKPKPAELADDPEDPDLSDLLDSALADFGKPVPAAPPAPSASASSAPSSNTDAEQADLSKAYKTFEEAMKQVMQGQDGAFGDQAFSSVMAGLAEEMASKDVDSADDPLAKTLADLSKNLSSDAEKMGSEPDMAELMKIFSGVGASGEGEGGGAAAGGAGLEAFMPLMQSVMSSILSKDVLYPSMKDVSERYPAWLEEHGPSLEPAELERYKKQHQLMRDVCAAYEAENENQQEKVFELMQQMQALGQPPKELVGDSPLADVERDPQGMPKLPPGLGGGDGECRIM